MYVCMYRVAHHVWDLGWGDFDVHVPLILTRCSSAHSAYISLQPTQNQADSGTLEIRFNPTQARDVMGHPVDFFRFLKLTKQM